MKPWLALGGGGMKCYVECAVLAEIERRSGKPVTDIFGGIIGTSGGAIIAGSVCAGNSASDTLGFFNQDGPNIFNTHFWTGSLALMRGYKFDPAPLEAALQRRFKGRIMLDSPIPLLMTAVDRNSKSAIFFKSTDPITQKYPMWQAARASSAAQTYFPPYQLNAWSLWDGGNAANNPAMCGYAQAIALSGAGQKFKLLSLGCGDVPWSETPANPTILDIITESLGVLLDCNDELPDYQLRQIMNTDFVSIQPRNITTGLADASPAALTSLNTVALQTIQDNSSLIDLFCGS
jgi:uncharacterized protein